MAFNEMRFHENAFPQKAFQRNAFDEIISTKCRKSMMGKNKGSPVYSFFLWGVITQQQLLDISAD